MAGIYSGVNVTLGNEYADKSFYGFRLDAPNGQLYFAKSHVNNTFYFGVDPIHLYMCGMSTGL